MSGNESTCACNDPRCQSCYPKPDDGTVVCKKCGHVASEVEIQIRVSTKCPVCRVLESKG